MAPEAFSLHRAYKSLTKPLQHCFSRRTEQSQDVLAHYNFIFSKNYKRFHPEVQMYWRVELKSRSMNWFTTMKLYLDLQEQSLDLVKRSLCILHIVKLVVKKKNFVIFGIFVVDNKHPNRSWVLLIAESVSPLDSTDVKGVFKAVRWTCTW